MALVEGIFSLRLVIADFYMEKPTLGLDPCYSEFRGKDIKRVPIIRIFGSNTSGQKTCMHVHGVFPYFYIPYERKDFESLSQAFYQIAINVDKAINISLGQSSSGAQHVFKIQLVKGVPFYGYHRKEHQYLKIYMFNPRFVRRASNLLQNGAILDGKVFHPHESHVPYILQFMIDFNLYGMSLLHVPFEVVKFRRTTDEEEIKYAGILPTQILSTMLAKKQSSSALEIDVSCNFILNRFQISGHSKSTHTNPGIESIWNDEQIRRQKMAMSIEDDMEKLCQIKPLEMPATQERTNVMPAESEVFFRTALEAKLLAMETSISGSGETGEQTINCTLQSNITDASLNITDPSKREQKRTFNLKKLLANAAYPEECTQDDLLINASFIENHLPNTSTMLSHFQATLPNSEKMISENNYEGDFLDETVVDEELVLTLTQKQHVPINATLREEDFELLDVLEQLEEVSVNKDHIDLDSSLAQLSQNHKKFDLSPELFDNEKGALTDKPPRNDNCSDSEHEDDDANINDFTMIMDDIDELLAKLTQSQPTTTESNVPQIDGSDDLPCTPKKKILKKNSNSTIAKLQQTSPRTPNRATITRRLSLAGCSPTRSPRTPKSAAFTKYAPLPLKITSKSEKKNALNNDNDATTSLNSACSSLQKEFSSKSHLPSSKRKTLASREELQTNNSKSNEIMCTLSKTATPHKNTRIPPRRSRRFKDLEKTHITCALTPRRSSERKLKVYNAENQKHIINLQNAIEINEVPEKESTNKYNKNFTERKSKFLNSKADKQKRTESEDNLYILGNKLPLIQNMEAIGAYIESSDDKTPPHFKKFDLPHIADESSDQDEAIESDSEFDSSMTISRRRQYLKRLRRSYHAAATRKSTANSDELRYSQADRSKSFTPKSLKKSTSNVDFESPRDVLIDGDLHALSFYEKSFTLHSPSVFSDVSLHSPSILTSHSSKNTHLAATDSKSSLSPSTIKLTPLDLPPTYDEALNSLQKFEIPENEFQQPFYNNPADVTQKKEIGFTVLSIPCNKLNDCPEFRSILGTDLKGLNDWRKQMLLSIGGPAMLNRFRSTQRIREYFANGSSVCITPQTTAPSTHDAKLWLKAKGLMSNKTEENTKINVEEDSPIKIQRKKVTMMLNDEDDATGSVDRDMDFSGRSFTLTPMTPISSLSREIDVQTLGNTQTPLTTLTKPFPSSAKIRKRFLKRSRTSLEQKFKDTASVQVCELQSKFSDCEIPKVKCVNAEYLLISGNSNSEIPANPSQKYIKDSQASNPSSISSQEVLLKMNSSSFVKNLQLPPSAEHDVSFGLSSATLNNTFGFKVNLENLQQAKSNIEYNYLTTFNLEIFVPTRGDLYPDPGYDEIRCIFYAVDNSIPVQETLELDQEILPRQSCGYIIVNDYKDINNKEGKIHGIDRDIKVQVVGSELEAMQALLELCNLWDPDIYAGYEIEMNSWGYVIERAKNLNLNISALLSRMPSQRVRDFVDEDRDQFTDLDVEMKLCGRILLDVWRLMRSEIALTSYSFENVMYHIMHRRCPSHNFRDLTMWFASPCSRWIVIEYYLERVRGTLALLDQLDLIGRTCEMAKLIGIQFYEVLSRGSQFRVESMMLRIAKPRNLVPLSPSVQQRAHMRAPEYLALIMEPLSRMYVDPVIVLDFQSLYPSMIIAYNYCFSTCLGRVEHLGQSSPFEFGASQLRVPPSMMRQLLDDDLITISPCGVVFVKSTVREGILPRMLTEILDTRLMVKQSMKLHKSNTALQRILHSRQLGLKLMANVTYGYTAANFSGRMPSVEVGDTVVSKGRETLERAIKMVEANEKWNVKVVYGDTDSMFIQVPGRTRAKAFEIGAEIAELVTQANPHPVKLKLEKVYQPCILQTKKRYVGYMYETPDQEEPIYEAKGIETVRRDGCPASVKMLEKVIRILFETKDVSQVKQYICRQFTKLLSGRANLQDLIFAKEFRGMNGYKPTACVPALELTRKWIQSDPRHIPRRGERVPYIITNGPPGVPLIRLVRSPHEVLADEGLRINAIYYITKAIIPPLNRCLLLIGADVNDWFTNLPRKILAMPALSIANELITTSVNAVQAKKSTISQYFSTTNCIIDCGRHTKNGICRACDEDATKTVAVLHNKITNLERGFYVTQQICQVCCGRVGDLKCRSLDCPVLYVLEVKRRELQQIAHFQNLLEERL